MLIASCYSSQLSYPFWSFYVLHLQKKIKQNKIKNAVVLKLPKIICRDNTPNLWDLRQQQAVPGEQRRRRRSPAGCPAFPFYWDFKGKLSVKQTQILFARTSQIFQTTLSASDFQIPAASPTLRSTVPVKRSPQHRQLSQLLIPLCISMKGHPAQLSHDIFNIDPLGCCGGQKGHLFTSKQICFLFFFLVGSVTLWLLRASSLTYGLTCRTS